MKRYRLLPLCCGFFLFLVACALAPTASNKTPVPARTTEPTFTSTPPITTTTAATTTVMLTATTAVTSGAATTASVGVTTTTALTVTPVLTATAVATTAQSAATPSLQGQGGTIATILAARPQFATLNRTVAAVALTNELTTGVTAYTLFAPTEDAFAALPAATLDTLFANPGLLTSVLQNHLLIEEVSSADLVRLGGVLTAFGETLPITLTADGVVQVSNATVVEADIDATNGVIHAIDTVLLPANLIITATNATATGVANATAPVTVTQAVTTGQIITTIATNATLADIVSGTEELTLLETALGAAGLLQVLQLPGELTLFAPTNAAFAALPDDQLQTLLNTTSDLAEVMQYHLVADTALAADLTRLGQALSTSSQLLTITVAADGTVQVNDAQIVQADIVATNGVIHVVDAVLLPSEE